MNKWKAQLLAGGGGEPRVVPANATHPSPAGPSDDPRRVIVESMSLMTEGRDDIVLDLTGTTPYVPRLMVHTGDLSTLKESKMQLKENATFKLKITFRFVFMFTCHLLRTHCVLIIIAGSSTRLLLGFVTFRPTTARAFDVSVAAGLYLANAAVVPGAVNCMMGSYGPKAESQTAFTQIQEVSDQRPLSDLTSP